MPVELALVLTLRRYHCDWRMPAEEVSDALRAAGLGDETPLRDSVLAVHIGSV
jgi:hypothetical protein